MFQKLPLPKLQKGIFSPHFLGPERNLLKFCHCSIWEACSSKKSFIFNNISSSKEKQILQGIGVKRILNVAKEIPMFHPEDFIYRKYAIDDDQEQNIIDILESATDFIRNFYILCQITVSNHLDRPRHFQRRNCVSTLCCGS